MTRHTASLALALLAVASVGAAREGDPGPVPAEIWIHAAETSAVVHWQTPRPGTSWVEYGPTEKLGKRTANSPNSPVTGRPCWTHVHRITCLETGGQYAFRTAWRGEDGRVVRGEVRRFKTARIDGAIRVPADGRGDRPIVLDRKGATYVLTRDLTVPLGGVAITADDVTLEMDGHTITYNTRPRQAPDDWPKRAYITEGHGFGVNVAAKGSARVLNGRIVQGDGNTPGTQVAIGSNPVYVRSAAVELGGLEIVWSARDVSGVYLHWGQGSRVHHCVFHDRGSEITNRHQAVGVVDGNGKHRGEGNLVLRTRQQGFQGAAKALHHEVYIDSHATNAFAIVGKPDGDEPVEIAHNRVVGIGEHPVGIAMFRLYPPGTSVHHNAVDVECTRSGSEYGYTGSACFRTTWGADNLDVHHNTFVGRAAMRGGKVAKTRVLWVGLPHFKPKGAEEKITDARGVFRDNVVRAVGRGGAKAGGICVVCLNESPNLIFAGNTVESTWAAVLLGDGYGHAGGYAKFVGNRFRRLPDEAGEYHDIRQDRPRIAATGAFLDNDYADAKAAILLGEQGADIRFQALLTVHVRSVAGKPAEAEVVVRDAEGKVVARGRTVTRKRNAMLVSDGETLAVREPVARSARGFVRTMEIAPGSFAAVVRRAVRTPEGMQRAGAYHVTVKHEDLSPVTKEVRPGKAPELTVHLPGKL